MTYLQKAQKLLNKKVGLLNCKHAASYSHDSRFHKIKWLVGDDISKTSI